MPFVRVCGEIGWDVLGNSKCHCRLSFSMACGTEMGGGTSGEQIHVFFWSQGGFWSLR